LKNCKEAATKKYYKDIDYNSARGSTERQFTRKKKREEEQE
jgi:hypothetical protein